MSDTSKLVEVRHDTYDSNSSTHNTQIERLWVEVGRQFAQRWKAFFTRLEQLHGLNRKNPHHLWLLQFLSLDLVNIDCEIFMEEWNHHPISGPTTNHQSPLDMHFLSRVENGVYITDPLHDVHPDILTRYYGTGGPPLSHIDDLGKDTDNSRTALQEEIAADMQSNLHDQPVPVPDHSNPFPSPEVEAIFCQALADVQSAGLKPDNSFFTASEWAIDTYETHKDISVGFRKTKTLLMSLPPKIWMPQALIWAQGLSVLHYLLEL
ncbi:hypothetical protein DFJ58DRAFT_662291 [Suillus subalutaceus]|uniref:uncharacterized protein n=1 Tax=Suillus subalutaceus TaxID=48586 RepID=UPI001B85CF1B|nr:uncharacterized protein DFJ58DRAFT_662291 [Suillus subalutaceus]KAG1849628.1 hypothetical protein DFJ58DRAFT_662291 [Suillus subalutaceus]